MCFFYSTHCFVSDLTQLSVLAKHWRKKEILKKVKKKVSKVKKAVIKGKNNQFNFYINNSWLRVQKNNKRLTYGIYEISLMLLLLLEKCQKFKVW